MATERQIERAVSIIRLLKELGTLSMEEIRAAMEILHPQDGLLVTKTIHRDIKTLRQRFGAPIEYDERLRVYVLKDREWRFINESPEISKTVAAVGYVAAAVENLLSEDLVERMKQAVLRSRTACLGRTRGCRC